jgi:hypothetical protein
MKKKIVSILVCMLLSVTAISVTGTEIVDKNEVNIEASLNQIPNDAPWDLIFNIDIGALTGGVSRSGCEFDGTYFYSTVWNSNLIDRIDSGGTLIETFSIPGVTGLRDLAYCDTDGSMYGGAAAGTIWEMDFINKVVIRTISGGFQSRAIGYDSDIDAFYCSNWGDPVWIVDRVSGSISGQFNLVTTTSTYGFAYDNVCTDQPYLWVFDQSGSPSNAVIYQWDLNAGAYTGFTYDVNNDIGSGTGIAGGLFITTEYDPSIAVIGGIYQDGDSALNTDFLFGYELCFLNAPPNTPSTPSGPTTGLVGTPYTYTSTTTDPEGDQVAYWFEWGDTTNSGWTGFVPSGDPGSATKTWTSAGTYEVTVKAKDTHGGESGFSSPLTVEIVEGPILDIGTITGGLFRVSAPIENVGGDTATNVQWTIDLVGGAFIGGSSSGTESSIAAAGSVTVQSGLIIGFGSTVVTVTATCDEGSSDSKTQDGFVFLIFINVKPGGG